MPKPSEMYDSDDAANKTEEFEPVSLSPTSFTPISSFSNNPNRSISPPIQTSDNSQSPSLNSSENLQLSQKISILEEQVKHHGNKMEDALRYLEQILDLEERNKEVFREESDEQRDAIHELQKKFSEKKETSSDIDIRLQEFETHFSKFKHMKTALQEAELKIEQQKSKINKVELRIKALEVIVSLFVIVACFTISLQIFNVI